MKRFCLLLVLAITLAGCTNPEPNAFEYKGSKVGDNSAVVGIAGSLPLHECYRSVELQTKKRPLCSCGASLNIHNPRPNVSTMFAIARIGAYVIKSFHTD